MIKLNVPLARLPCATVDELEAIIWKAIPRRNASSHMQNLIEYAIRSAHHQGLAVDGESVWIFLDGEVRYHLDSDVRTGLIDFREYAKLDEELNRLVSCSIVS